MLETSNYPIKNARWHLFVVLISAPLTVCIISGKAQPIWQLQDVVTILTIFIDVVWQHYYQYTSKIIHGHKPDQGTIIVRFW